MWLYPELDSIDFFEIFLYFSSSHLLNFRNFDWKYQHKTSKMECCSWKCFHCFNTILDFFFGKIKSRNYIFTSSFNWYHRFLWKLLHLPVVIFHIFSYFSIIFCSSIMNKHNVRKRSSIFFIPVCRMHWIHAYTSKTVLKFRIKHQSMIL